MFKFEIWAFLRISLYYFHIVGLLKFHKEKVYQEALLLSKKWTGYS